MENLFHFIFGIIWIGGMYYLASSGNRKVIKNYKGNNGLDEAKLKKSIFFYPLRRVDEEFLSNYLTSTDIKNIRKQLGDAILESIAFFLVTFILLVLIDAIF